MRQAAKIARDDTITEALRVANDAIGSEPPTPQTFRILAAIKAMRSNNVRVTTGGVDYLARVQQAAQSLWREQYKDHELTMGGECSVSAGIDTPLGRLTCRTWRTVWKHGRIAWASEYMLGPDFITVREIKNAGLAQRPTSRNRQSKKEPR